MAEPPSKQVASNAAWNKLQEVLPDKNQGLHKEKQHMLRSHPTCISSALLSKQLRAKGKQQSMTTLLLNTGYSQPLPTKSWDAHYWVARTGKLPTNQLGHPTWLSACYNLS